MSININLGNWSSVFAVPSVIVDKHIKLAGSAQLKVLLWILRHAGESFSVDTISSALNMHPADVNDAMQYWIETGLLAESNDTLAPVAENMGSISASDTSQRAEQKAPAPHIPNQTGTYAENTQKPPETKPVRQLSRPQRPDTRFVAQRINDDPEIALLMQEAEVIFGRPISSGDSAVLLMMHDDDGLPTDVILMLLNYAVGEKHGMRYIEKMAIDWANEGIKSIEAAEEKIRRITENNRAWNIVKDIFGLKTVGSPTKTQIECANRWLNEWHLPTDVIREAYERCLDTKGEYKLSYIDGIIKRWHASGIVTVEQVKRDVKPSAKHNYTETDDKRSPSYDISEYENTSIFD
ncbi:MAG: DnaD domain protein [Acutalibacteraceae bacterium]